MATACWWGFPGGKDSMSLLELLALRSRVFKPRFEVEAAFVGMRNIPYKNDEDYLRGFAESLGVRLHLFETEFDETTDERRTHCFLCSWHRRKVLFDAAQRLGCNKIALGHHRDDLMETALMNLTFEGKFHTMPPRLRMEKFPGGDYPSTMPVARERHEGFCRSSGVSSAGGEMPLRRGFPSGGYEGDDFTVRGFESRVCLHFLHGNRTHFSRIARP